MTKKNETKSQSSSIQATPIILVTQEDHGSKPAWANSSQDPLSKIPNTGGVAQMVECLPRPVWRPEFKPHYCKKNKEQNNE
jgi:hypothetical protein